MVPGSHTVYITVPSGYSFDYYYYLYGDTDGYIRGGYLYSNPATIQITQDIAITAVFSSATYSFEPSIVGPNLFINNTSTGYYAYWQPTFTYANTTYVGSTPYSNIYTFDLTSLTPDGSNPLYIINWGDNSGYTEVWGTSGIPLQVSHAWASIGNYTIYVYVYDPGTETCSPIAKLNFTMLWPGDLNGDGKVNFSDEVIFINAYDQYYSTPSVYTVLADFNHDHVINFNDICAFVNVYDGYYQYAHPP